MKKKFISGILTVVLLCSMNTTVFAADIALTPEDATTTAPVNVKVINPRNVDTETTYSVNIVWGDLDFTYKFDVDANTAITWDPESHAYKVGNSDAVIGSWTSDTKRTAVTVTNHSNAPVDVITSFTDGGSSALQDGVTATLSNTAINNEGGEGLTTITDSEGKTVALFSPSVTTVSTSKTGTGEVLQSGVGTTYADAPALVSTIEVSGVPTVVHEVTDGDEDPVTETFTVGTILINISKAE
jgi:hypothetical protein